MKNLALIGLMLCCAAGAATAKSPPLYPIQDCGRYTVQNDMNICANANEEAADKALNAIYKQVLASRPADKDGLRQTERIWIQYRDKTCADQVGPQEDGGSIWPMDIANCLQTETDKRIRSLQHMLVCSAGVSVCNPH
ncbi:MAG TPA: lysozyme inhibitor LprI family protein [Rhizomicrobium sp.]|nr:lysozyme inhibitor LprI family protein [Rhizomicrobium sp.]